MLFRGERFLLTVKKFEECLIVFLAFIFIIGGRVTYDKNKGLIKSQGVL